MMNELEVATLWIIIASILGFGISAIFSAWRNLHRRTFLIPYIILASTFLYGFIRLNTIDLEALIEQNLLLGIAVGVIVGGFLIISVRSQPYTQQSTGGKLLLDLIWSGLAYGIIDALLLNVMPVLAVLGGSSQFGWEFSWLDRIGVAVIALFASLLVTLAYHLGYKEFRNRSIGLVLVGNAIITLAYLVSGNPLGAVISHVVMHIAAVIQGPETTIQLPPHRQQRI
jgi:hypothetical protein